MAITVEIRDPKELSVIHIYLNDDDIQTLIDDLERIMGKTGHIDYMSPDWGGDGLGTNSRLPGALIAHHLCIVRVDDG